MTNISECGLQLTFEESLACWFWSPATWLKADGKVCCTVYVGERFREKDGRHSTAHAEETDTDRLLLHGPELVGGPSWTFWEVDGVKPDFLCAVIIEHHADCLSRVFRSW